MAVESRRRQLASVAGILLIFTWVKLSVIQNSNLDNIQRGHKPKSVNSRNSFATLANVTTHFNTPIRHPGVILDTKGGIGNQLFEYACSYALARKTNGTLYNFVNNSTMNSNRKFTSLQRDFALDNFQIPLDNLMDKTTQVNGSNVAYIHDRELFYRNYTAKPFLQLAPASYCQSEGYWSKYKEELKHMFKPKMGAVNISKISHFLEQIENTESVAVHVRRGDFVATPFFYMPTTYQRTAIHRIVQNLHQRGSPNPTFFVFSDDSEFAQRKLQDLEETYGFKFIYVSQGNHTSIEDFYLMSKCKHIIIPNSTFGWWAAYLNENPEKIVIAAAFNPSFFDLWNGNKDYKHFYKVLHGQKYHPKEWIVIDPFVGEG